MKINDGTVIGIKELELVTGLKSSRLSELEAKGIIIRAGYGKYKLVETLNNYRDYIGNKLSGNNSGTAEFQNDRARKVLHEANILERRNEREDAQFLEAGVAAREITEGVRISLAIVDSFKDKVLSIDTVFPERVHTLLDKETEKMRTALVELSESYKSSTVESAD